jgi:hypothetical protein
VVRVVVPVRATAWNVRVTGLVPVVVSTGLTATLLPTTVFPAKPKVKPPMVGYPGDET